MAIYEYLCADDGLFESHARIGTAATALPCPRCGAESPRIVSMPRVVGSRHAALGSAIERSLRSAHEPEVVSALPPGGPRRVRTVTPTPALRSLPRPMR